MGSHPYHASFRRLLLLLLLSTSSLTWSQRPATSGTRFNRCLDSLDSATLVDPGFRVLLEDLNRLPSYKEVIWNVNHKYRKGALNLIIPRWDDSFWPAAACADLPRQPADCVTSPKEKFVICNPAVGRQLMSPLLQSGIASIQEEFGSHFILLTLIGHELGHIRLSKTSLTQHLIRFQNADGLKCYRRPEGVPPMRERTSAEPCCDDKDTRCDLSPRSL